MKSTLQIIASFLLLGMMIGCCAFDSVIEYPVSTWECEHLSGQYRDFIHWTHSDISVPVSVDISDLFLTPLAYVGNHVCVKGNITDIGNPMLSFYEGSIVATNSLAFMETLALDQLLKQRISCDGEGVLCVATNAVVCGMFDVASQIEYWGLDKYGWPASEHSFCIQYAHIIESEIDLSLTDVAVPPLYYRSPVEEFKLHFILEDGRIALAIHYYSGIVKVLCLKTCERDEDEYLYCIGSIWGWSNRDIVLRFLDELPDEVFSNGRVTKSNCDGFVRAMPFSSIETITVGAADNRELFKHLYRWCKNFVKGMEMTKER